jgi:hypothetical protein
MVVVVVVAKTTKGRPIASRCCWLCYGACRNLAAVAMAK